MMAEQHSNDTNLRAEYQEVCSNFRLLSDIRFKLIALLPIGTGAGIALTMSGQSSVSSPLIGLFGLAVTFSAALYNLRNDQLYNALVGRAAHLERLLELKDEAFAQRPRVWQRAGPFKVSHGQIWWIYLASLAAWLFVIVHGVNVPWPPILSNVASQLPEQQRIALAEAGSALVIVLLMALVVRSQQKKSSERLREAARKAVEALKQIPVTETPNQHDSWGSVLRHASILSGRAKERHKTEEQLLFYLRDAAADLYWDRPPAGQQCDARAASQLLALVMEMPSRWIFDVPSGRRE